MTFRHVFAKEDRIGERILDFIGLGENIRLIVADNVLDTLRIARPDQAITDVRLDDMLEAVIPGVARIDLGQRRRVKVESPEMSRSGSLFT